MRSASKAKTIVRAARKPAAHTRAPKVDPRVSAAEKFLLPTYKRAPIRPDSRTRLLRL